MDYKQKYKEALERAKYLKENTDSVNAKDISCTFEYIFPELSGSEDERIRKAIKEAVENYWSDDTQALTDILAWLEKQGEKKSSWNEEDEKFFKTALWHISNSVSNGKDLEGHCATTEWLKSLKDRVQPQPKQEWSENDEKKIMWLVRLISTAGYRELETDKMPCSRIELLDWLKAFKDRVQFQPKQEWSEKDEKISNALYQSIDFLCLKSFGFSEDDVCDWLKCIKSKHWKPSEQNIKDLEWCADLVKDKMGVGFHRLQVFIDEIKSL